MIFITGDCHGDYRKLGLSYFTGREMMDRSDYVIICGDFGYWDGSREEEYWLNWLESQGYTVLFVDGNHENYDMLSELPVVQWNGGKIQKIRESVFRLMRGQVFTLQGLKFFTFGGARSHDTEDGILDDRDPDLLKKVRQLEEVGARYRINHLTWWKEEMASKEEMEEGRRSLEAHNWRCDYVITHCAPTSVQAELSLGRYAPDELTDYLEEVKRRCKYKAWYFGHYHEDEAVDEKHMVLYRDIRRLC